MVPSVPSLLVSQDYIRYGIIRPFATFWLKQKKDAHVEFMALVEKIAQASEFAMLTPCISVYFGKERQFFS